MPTTRSAPGNPIGGFFDWITGAGPDPSASPAATPAPDLPPTSAPIRHSPGAPRTPSPALPTSSDPTGTIYPPGNPLGGILDRLRGGTLFGPKDPGIVGPSIPPGSIETQRPGQWRRDRFGQLRYNPSGVSSFLTPGEEIYDPTTKRFWRFNYGPSAGGPNMTPPSQRHFYDPLTRFFGGERHDITGSPQFESFNESSGQWEHSPTAPHWIGGMPIGGARPDSDPRSLAPPIAGEHRDVPAAAKKPVSALITGGAPAPTTPATAPPAAPGAPAKADPSTPRAPAKAAPGAPAAAPAADPRTMPPGIQEWLRNMPPQFRQMLPFLMFMMRQMGAPAGGPGYASPFGATADTDPGTSGDGDDIPDSTAPGTPVATGTPAGGGDPGGPDPAATAAAAPDVPGAGPAVAANAPGASPAAGPAASPAVGDVPAPAGAVAGGASDLSSAGPAPPAPSLTDDGLAPVTRGIQVASNDPGFVPATVAGALGPIRRGIASQSHAALSGAAGYNFGQPFNTRLAQARTRYGQELQAKPWLREKFRRILYNEQGSNPQGIQAVAESAINRAIVRGTSLEQQLRWHGSERGGYYAMGNMGRGSDRYREVLDRAIDNALAGSNLASYSTDNSSGSLAHRDRASGRFRYRVGYHGESFFAPGYGRGGPGPKQARAWEQWAAAMEEPAVASR